MNVYVEALVRFPCVMPDDEDEADAHADTLSQAIEEAVQAVVVNHGGFPESVSVIDWTQKEDV